MRGHDLCRSRASPQKSSDRKRTKRRCDKGVTLIEVVLVIVVLGILAFIVSLNLSSLDTIKLNNATSKVIADLRYAQQLAKTTRSQYGLCIENATTYSVHLNDGIGSACTPYVKDPANLGSDLTVDFTSYQQGKLNGVQFNPLVPFCGLSVIEFNSLGTPVDTSGNALTCDSPVVLTNSGATDQTITIVQKTGRIY